MILFCEKVKCKLHINIKTITLSNIEINTSSWHKVVLKVGQNLSNTSFVQNYSYETKVDSWLIWTIYLSKVFLLYVKSTRILHIKLTFRFCKVWRSEFSNLTTFRIDYGSPLIYTQDIITTHHKYSFVAFFWGVVPWTVWKCFSIDKEEKEVKGTLLLCKSHYNHREWDKKWPF